MGVCYILQTDDRFAMFCLILLHLGKCKKMAASMLESKRCNAVSFIFHQNKTTQTVTRLQFDTEIDSDNNRFHIFATVQREK